MKLAMREITGINTDLLGGKSDDTSGIAIARRQAQGQIISTVFFDRFKWTRMLIYKRLARRVQQILTTEKILRLIHPDTRDHATVSLNPAEAREMDPDRYQQWLEQKRNEAGRPYILRNVEALDYDVTLSESPTTPSARATALLALLEIVGKMPAILPAVVDEILNLAEIPEKPKILRRVRAIMAQQGIDVDGKSLPPAGLPTPVRPPPPDGMGGPVGPGGPGPTGPALPTATPIPPPGPP